MLSTTVLPINQRWEDGSWQPRCPVAQLQLCWDASPPSPRMKSLFCLSIVLEKAKHDKEKELHVSSTIKLHKCLFAAWFREEPQSHQICSDLISLWLLFFNISSPTYVFSPVFPVTPYKGPRNLQTSEPSKTSFRVTWDHAPGDVKGYKVTFHPVGEDIDLGELLVGPYDNTVVLEELRCVVWFVFS